MALNAENNDALWSSGSESSEDESEDELQANLEFTKKFSRKLGKSSLTMTKITLPSPRPPKNSIGAVNGSFTSQSQTFFLAE